MIHQTLIDAPFLVMTLDALPITHTVIIDSNRCPPLHDIHLTLTPHTDSNTHTHTHTHTHTYPGREEDSSIRLQLRAMADVLILDLSVRLLQQPLLFLVHLGLNATCVGVLHGQELCRPGGENLNKHIRNMSKQNTTKLN